MKFPITLIILILLCSCKNEPLISQADVHSSQITSLSGKALEPPRDLKKVAIEKDKNLRAAHLDYTNYPDSLDAHIWYGRRLAYVYKYQEAIDVYTQAIEQFPNSPELYRHRGHRYITSRKFNLAIADFEKAASIVDGKEMIIEADGIPNQLNKPLSNLHFNIWYHWGLAYFLKGDYTNARLIYEECLAYSDNPDLMVATVDWLYMTYIKLGLKDEALAILDKVHQHMIMIENDSYFKRIMMYKGIFKPEDLIDPSKNKTAATVELITQGFGVAQWHESKGHQKHAHTIYQKILESNQWHAFSYIAAEAEITRD